MSEGRASTSCCVHVIPSERLAGEQGILGKRSRDEEHKQDAIAQDLALSPELVLSDFDQACSMLHCMYAGVIKAEADQIEKDVLEMQEQMEEAEGPASKRARCGSPHPFSTDDSEDVSVFLPGNQTENLHRRSTRIMRMASLLRHYEALVQNLRPDLTVCLGEYQSREE